MCLPVSVLSSISTILVTMLYAPADCLVFPGTGLCLPYFTKYWSQKKKSSDLYFLRRNPTMLSWKKKAKVLPLLSKWKIPYAAVGKINSVLKSWASPCSKCVSLSLHSSAERTHHVKFAQGSQVCVLCKKVRTSLLRVSNSWQTGDWAAYWQPESGTMSTGLWPAQASDRCWILGHGLVTCQHFTTTFPGESMHSGEYVSMFLQALLLLWPWDLLPEG